MGSSEVVNYRKLYHELWSVEDNEILLFATENGYLPLVEAMVKKHVNIHACNDLIFRLAALNGRLNIIRFLVEHIFEDEGPTGVSRMIHAHFDGALQYAAEYGRLDVAKFLVKYVVESEGPESVIRMIDSGY